MIITRTGSAANHGPRSVALTNGTYSISNSGNVTFSHRRVRDFTGNAHHSYFIELGPSDIVAILAALAEAVLEKPERHDGYLAPALKSLCVLQAAAAGTLSTRRREER